MNKSTYMRAPNGEVFQTINASYHPKCADLGSGAKGYQARRDYVCRLLRKMIKPNQTVYTMLRSVSASGMSRNISVFIVEKGNIRCIDQLVSDAIANSQAKDGSLRVHGCGMDMGYHVVHTLGHYLWPKGTRKPHGTRNGQPNSDGGYALKHEWL